MLTCAGGTALTPNQKCRLLVKYGEVVSRVLWKLSGASSGNRSLHPHADLLDDLIGPHEHRWRNRKTERLGGLHVDDQLELRRLFDGQVAGLRPLEDLVHVSGG